MMIYILTFFIGLLLGAGVLYFYLNEKLHTALQNAEAIRAKQTYLEEQEQNLRTECHQLREENKYYISQNNQLQSHLSALEKQVEKEDKERQERFDKQLKILESQMKEMARQIMEDNSQRLKKDNTDSMAHLTHPLQEALKDVREQIANHQKENEKHKGAFEEQLRLLYDINKEMGNKASELAEALKGNNKLQGDWGEMILENLLRAEGLKEGEDYELQCRLKDFQGRDLHHSTTNSALQPDAILHYPKSQDVVIDAKTSLKAYLDYVATDDPEEKQKALTAHIKSVREHVKELSKKDYSNYILPPRQAIEFVVMFVPNETALQLALTHDPHLWKDAFDAKVLMAGELNLRAILRIIRIIWRQHQQVANQQEVFRVAEELLKRVGEFIERYDKVGKNIDTLKRSFDEGTKKLYGKRFSIIGLSNDLKKCGVKDNPNHAIPENTDIPLIEEE